MSNVSLKERIAIDKRKLAGKEKRKTDLLFALEQVEAEIRYLNDRIRYNEKRAKEREEREAESEDVSLFPVPTEREQE